MAFTGSWNTAVDEGDRACKHERDEDERDAAPLYRLLFIYRGTTIDGFVRVRFERDRLLVCSGRGTDEQTAVRALRDNLRELRVRRARHIPMGAWEYAFESEVES